MQVLRQGNHHLLIIADSLAQSFSEACACAHTLNPPTPHPQSLRLSSRARRTSTVGEIVNLMSVDAQRLMDLMNFIHLTWSAPLQIVLSLIFLYLTMGPSIFAGVAVMILMIPVNSIVAAINRRLQVRQMSLKDSRVKLINEVLNGIKVCLQVFY